MTQINWSCSANLTSGSSFDDVLIGALIPGLRGRRACPLPDFWRISLYVIVSIPFNWMMSK